MEQLAHLGFQFRRNSCGEATPDFECLLFDPFPFQQNGLASTELDIGRCQVSDVFAVTQIVVVADEVTES
jgi:hypothetical protein